MNRGARTFLGGVVGCVVGLFVVGAIGYALGALYVWLFMPDAGLEALMPPLVGVVVGGSLGGVAGISMGVLFARRDRNASDE